MHTTTLTTTKTVDVEHRFAVGDRIQFPWNRQGDLRTVDRIEPNAFGAPVYWFTSDTSSGIEKADRVGVLVPTAPKFAAGDTIVGRYGEWADEKRETIHRVDIYPFSGLPSVAVIQRRSGELVYIYESDKIGRNWDFVKSVDDDGSFEKVPTPKFAVGDTIAWEAFIECRVDKIDGDDYLLVPVGYHDTKQRVKYDPCTWRKPVTEIDRTGIKIEHPFYIGDLVTWGCQIWAGKITGIAAGRCTVQYIGMLRHGFTPMSDGYTASAKIENLRLAAHSEIVTTVEPDETGEPETTEDTGEVKEPETTEDTAEAKEPDPVADYTHTIGRIFSTLTEQYHMSDSNAADLTREAMRIAAEARR